MPTPAEEYKSAIMIGDATIDEVVSLMLREYPDRWRIENDTLIRLVKSPIQGLVEYKVTVVRGDGTSGVQWYFLHELIK